MSEILTSSKNKAKILTRLSISRKFKLFIWLGEYFHKLCSGLLEIRHSSVYVVPAFAGLGAPYWDMYARGAIFGLTRDTGKAHLAKATLESLAYQTKDILNAMEEDSGVELQNLKVDGGACANNYLMQFQADILGTEVHRPKVIESTAMGAAFLAGIQVGFWTQEDIDQSRPMDRIFKPNFEKEKRDRLYKTWQKAVERTKGWEEN